MRLQILFSSLIVLALGACGQQERFSDSSKLSQLDHLAQELCAAGVCVSESWTARTETSPESFTVTLDQSRLAEKFESPGEEALDSYFARVASVTAKLKQYQEIASSPGQVQHSERVRMVYHLRTTCYQDALARLETLAPR